MHIHAFISLLFILVVAHYSNSTVNTCSTEALKQFASR